MGDKPSKPWTNYRTGDCLVPTTSVDHSSGKSGQFFNFDRSILDNVVDRTNWNTNNFDVRNTRTSKSTTVKVWRSRNGGSTGSAHGRKDPKSSADDGDWEIGDVLVFKDYFCGDCSFPVMSNDYRTGPTGRYFNFARKVLDNILGRTNWNGEVTNVYNSRTAQTETVKIWRSQNGGSSGTAHGRKDPKSSSGGGDWEIGDVLTFKNYFCDSAPIYLESTNYPWTRIRDESNKLYVRTKSNDDYSTFNLISIKSGDYWKFMSESRQNQYIYTSGSDVKIGGASSNFEIVDALTRREGYHSIKRKDTEEYLRHRNGRIYLDAKAYNDQYEEDASFKIRCKDDNKCPISHFKCDCPINRNNVLSTSSGSYLPLSCNKDSNWVNGWDGVHDNIGSTKQFISGQWSIHDNGREDRRFKWKYCKQNDEINPYVGDAIKLSKTSLDQWIHKSCPGESAMIGALSWHTNDKEDREWEFYCGNLNSEKYMLVSCSWTAYANNFDGPVAFECPDNGVIRSIKGDHRESKSDRRWKFECCNIALKLDLSNPRGSWSTIRSCVGCSSQSYTTSIGVEDSQTNSRTSEYTTELAVAVEQGFELMGMGGSISVSAGSAETTSETVEISQSYAWSEENTLECEKDYLYQWKITATESWNNEENEIQFRSNYFICSDSADIKCPPGLCVDSSCQTCTDLEASANEELFKLLSDDTTTFNPDVTNGVYLVVMAVAILLVINFMCCIYYVCFRNKNYKYQKVSIKSDGFDESEIGDV